MTDAAGHSRPPDAAQRDRLLREAMRLHRAQDLLGAELLYRRILQSDPNHAEVLHLLGNIALAVGRTKDAEGLLARALILRPADPDFAICLGNALAMQGHFVQAADQYRLALRGSPGYHEARFNLANALRDAGRAEEAIDEYRGVIAARPRFSPAHNNLANLLHYSGRTDEALRAIGDFLKIAPKDAAGHFNKGVFLREADREGDAERAFREAVRCDPRFAPAQNALGAWLFRQGRHDEAREHFRRALEVDPTQRESLLNLARMESSAGRKPEAVRLLRRYLALERDNTEARSLLAMQLLQGGRLVAAREEYQKLVVAKPDDPMLRVNLGNVLQETGRTDDAVEQFREALKLDPALFGAHYNLGITLRKKDQPREALEHFHRALAHRPRDVNILRSIGNAHRDLLEYEGAETWLRRAVAVDPASSEARMDLGGLLLSAGEFGEGWDLDAARFEGSERHRLDEYPQRPWRGEPLDGKRVLVWTEQAPGDQIMFLEALPDLVERAASVVLECSARLAALVSRSFPGVDVVPRSTESVIDPRVQVRDIDFQLPMSGLQRHFRRSWDSFPNRAGYLKADPAKVEAWRSRLSGLGPGLKVGISWRGGTPQTQQRHRTVPLALWPPLLGTAGARFVSLQYGKVREELEALKLQSGVDVTHWPEAIEDFDETAALLAALDVVISVPTTAIHVAGALGVPTWILVPQRPGFRYLRSGKSMPWYPSVSLFRQSAPDHWEEPLAEIARELSRTAAADPANPR